MAKTLDVYFINGGECEPQPAASLNIGNGVNFLQQLKKGLGIQLFGQFSEDGENYGALAHTGSAIGLSGTLQVNYESEGLAKVLLNDKQYDINETSEPISLGPSNAIKFVYRD